MKILFEIDKKDYDPSWPHSFRPSVRGIIVRNGKVMAVYSKKGGYYKFPGGGIEQGEDHTAALIREVREEVGLIVAPESIREFGYVRRLSRSEMGGILREMVFEQDNYYYCCEVEDAKTNQDLDPYEAELEYVLCAVDPSEAARVNHETAVRNKGEIMIEREARVFELVAASIG